MLRRKTTNYKEQQGLKHQNAISSRRKHKGYKEEKLPKHQNEKPPRRKTTGKIEDEQRMNKSLSPPFEISKTIEKDFSKDRLNKTSSNKHSPQLTPLEINKRTKDRKSDKQRKSSSLILSSLILRRNTKDDKKEPSKYKNTKPLGRKTTGYKEEQRQSNVSLSRTFETPETDKVKVFSKDHFHRTRSINHSPQLPPLQISIKIDKQRRSSSLLLSSNLLFSRRRSFKEFHLGSKITKIIEIIGLQRAHVIKLHKSFKIIDIDNSESIFINELFELLNETRTSYTDRLFIFLGIDVKKKTLQFNEFVVICAVYCILTKDDILQFCYESYDKDNSGLLDIKEFQAFIKAVNEPSTIVSGVSKKAFYVCDKDLDCFLDRKEFMSLQNRFPFLMFPIFRLQDHMQEKTLGESTWNKIHVDIDNDLKKRNKNFSSNYTNTITMYSILKQTLD